MPRVRSGKGDPEGAAKVQIAIEPIAQGNHRHGGDQREDRQAPEARALYACALPEYATIQGETANAAPSNSWAASMALRARAIFFSFLLCSNWTGTRLTL
jgi:hypothetical protein